MFKLAGISACLFALAGLSGCSGQVPIEVELRPNTLNDVMGVNLTPNIVVTSKVDQIQVNSVEINRGNCKPSGDAMQLKFGQSMRFITYSCDIKEVEVNTDKGNFTFTF